MDSPYVIDYTKMLLTIKIISISCLIFTKIKDDYKPIV